MIYAKLTHEGRTIDACHSCGEFHDEMGPVEVRWVVEQRDGRRCEVPSCGQLLATGKSTSIRSRNPASK